MGNLNPGNIKVNRVINFCFQLKTVSELKILLAPSSDQKDFSLKLVFKLYFVHTLHKSCRIWCMNGLFTI